MTDYERVKKLLDYLKISANKLSKLLGMRSPQIFYDIKSGKCGISKDLVKRIQEKFCNINAGWLLTGEGSMILSEEPCPELLESPEDECVAEQGAERAQEHVSPGKSGLTAPRIPLVDIKLVGNDDMDGVAMGGWEACDMSAYFSTGIDGDLAVCQHDDSMAPVIPAGSILLIRKVKYWKEFLGYGNDFVVVLVDGRRVTKTLVKGDREDEVLARSYNPMVADERLPVGIISEMWKVISVCSNKGW